MTIFNLYMFDRQGVLIYYGEWNRKRQSGMTIEEVCINISFQVEILSTLQFNLYSWYPLQEAKLMYGMLYSIRNFVAKMSPTDPQEGFQCYRTSKYKLNYLETPTGITYVMNTDLNAPNVRELLQLINNQVTFEWSLNHLLLMFPFVLRFT